MGPRERSHRDDDDEDQGNNGPVRYSCRVYDTGWEEYKKAGLDAMEKIDQIHNWGVHLQAIDKNTSYLATLDPISSAAKITLLVARLTCVIVGAVLVLTAIAVGAKVVLTPTSISTSPTSIVTVPVPVPVPVPVIPQSEAK